MGYFPVILCVRVSLEMTMYGHSTHHWYAYQAFETAASLGPGYLAAG